MHDSKIEWVLNPDNKTLGKIWNPITGCLNGCSYCYAQKLANGRLKQRYLANEYVAGCEDMTYPRLIECMADPFYPRFWSSRLDEDLGICRGIFVVDMGDLFGVGVPEEWTRGILDRIRRSSHRNRYYLLTKQPQNLTKFSPFPDNCWVGVTATDYWKYVDACNYLARIEAKVKYISFEPLLSWDKKPSYFFNSGGIKWLIIGTQTKPYKPPLKLWVDEITEACKAVNIPYFLKDNLRPLMGNDLVQDMPIGVEIDY